MPGYAGEPGVGRGGRAGSERGRARWSAVILPDMSGSLLIFGLFWPACTSASPQSAPTPTEVGVTQLAAGRPERAAAAFETGCGADELAACDALGKLLSAGRGVPADPGRAENLHRRACDGGLAAGCANLGALVAGRGDPEGAAELFRRACVAGEVAGCSNLAVMYALGRGVERDPDRAAFLTRWACDGGDSTACGRLTR